MKKMITDTPPITLMTAEYASDMYAHLENMGIKIWIDGGWSVDALLGKQLRSHHDLDIALQSHDVPRLREILTAKGYKQVREDGPWNFVLADTNGHEIDVHVFVCDDKGNIVDGIMYPAESLTGTGTIHGQPVRCISPRYMIKFLAPWIYKWPEKYVPVVYELCKKYGLALPQEYQEYIKNKAHK